MKKTSEKSMRILLITDNHTETGGAESYFFDLKRRLQQVSGLDVYSLGFGPKKINQDRTIVMKAAKSKISKLIWQILFHPLLFLKLRHHLKKINPDVIHIHNVKQYTASLLLAIRHYPVIQTVHDYSVICPTAQNIHKDRQICKTGFRFSCFWQHQVKFNQLIYLAQVFAFLLLKNKLKKTVNYFLVPSPLLGDYLKKNNFKNVKHMMPFRKDNDLLGDDDAFEKIKPHHFFFAGHLAKHKGVDILIEEFALAFQQNPRLTLTIAGIGELEHALRKKVKALNLENHIFFVGWQNDLTQEFKQCAAIIFPSIGCESFGLVITEAMNQARAVIAANRSTAPWLIDDNATGILFNPLCKGELAEKLLKLAGNKDLIKRLGLGAYKKLRELIKDNEVLVEEMIGIYKRVQIKKAYNLQQNQQTIT